MTVEDAGAVADAVSVTVALHVGLHGLLENTDAVTPLGRAVSMLKVTGAVVASVASVAVAVSTPPAAPSVACIVITVEEAGAVAEAVRVRVAMHVGLQGLFVKADAVTPDGRAVRMLKVTGDVVAEAFRVAVAVSTPPAAPSVIDREAGLAARVKSKNPETTRVNVAVCVTVGEPPLAWMVITVEEAGAFAAALKVIVEL